MLQAAGNPDLLHTLDRMVIQKVLPRLHGTRRKLEPTLCALGRFCHTLTTSTEKFDPEKANADDARLKASFDKVLRMTRSLRANGFTSYTES